MKRIHLDIIIPENVGELKKLERKVIGVIPGNNNSVPIPLVYFGSHNGIYEFLQQGIVYDITKRKSLFSKNIHADIIPQDALEFMERGIIFDHVQRWCSSKTYCPDDEDYNPRLTALQENGLWISTRRGFKTK